jgi:hypothetical protein
MPTRTIDPETAERLRQARANRRAEHAALRPLPTPVMLAIYDAANDSPNQFNTLVKCWERLYDNFSKPHQHAAHTDDVQRAAVAVRDAYERYADIQEGVLLKIVR